MGATDSIIVSYVENRGDGDALLVVGRKTPGEVCDIINAFEGEEAKELYLRLTTKR